MLPTFGHYLFECHSLNHRRIRVKFAAKGHRVKVKVTRAKKIDNLYSRSVKLRSATTLRFYKTRSHKLACSRGFRLYRMVWPSSLSRDRKWPRLTKWTHSRAVGLRLKGSLVNIIKMDWFATLSPNAAGILCAVRVINASEMLMLRQHRELGWLSTGRI